MRFEDFVGNATVVARLRLRLREGRFPHGLLFAGPEGVGKRTCALMFAKALNCSVAEPDNFCDACTQCRKIEAGVHADVLLVQPEEPGSAIKIAQVRDLLHTLTLRPLEGRHKVYIIDPADAMNDAASNALLKGLEEPPDDTSFMLVSANPQALLVTVRSRCQTYAFGPVPSEELRSFGSDELAIRWARGSIGFLKALDSAALRKRRDAALEFLETAIQAKQEQFDEVISASADLSRSKAEFEPHLNAMAVLMEDLLYLREGLPGRIVNVDIEPRLRKLMAIMPPEQFMRISSFLRTIEINLERNVNRQMLTDSLALTANATLYKINNDKIANDNPAKSR
jgi:DNA polymerase-3 subunit delta'